MTPAKARPWTRLYPPGIPADLPAPTGTVLDAFRATVTADPEAPAIHFFDTRLSFGRLDRDSDALAAALAQRGVGPGDRVAVYLQNDPQFQIAQLAAWKCGATMVSVNPMLKEQEL